MVLSPLSPSAKKRLGSCTLLWPPNIQENAVRRLSVLRMHRGVDEDTELGLTFLSLYSIDGT